MRPTELGQVTLEYAARPPNAHYLAGFHTGRDYRALTPTPIRATRAGLVVFAGVYGGWGQSYGNHVIVQTGVGARAVRHSYNHLSRIYVKRGRLLRAGTIIGLSGHTGHVTGPHLHFEERRPPYSYWDHRRPQFDLAPPAIWDVSDLVWLATGAHEVGTAKSHHPAQVRSVAGALVAAGCLNRRYVSGHWSRFKADAYRRWETKRGWTPTGVPGPEGLGLLAALHGQPGTIVRP